MEDLAQLPTVRFTQEKMMHLPVQRNLSIPVRVSEMFKETDRATRMGILGDSKMMLMRQDQAF